MFFYLAMIALMPLHMAAAVTTTLRENAMPRWLGPAHFLLVSAASLIAIAPLLEANGVIRADIEYGLILPAFAILSMLVCISTARAAMRAQPRRSRIAALGTVGAVATLLLIPAGADSALFYDDPSKVGVANAALLGASDVQCERLVLIRFTEHDAIYRCPVGFVWGQYSRFPFAPQYETGRSVQLKDSIAAMMANAKHIGGDHEQTRD